MDETDDSLWFTALRECNEEIGLDYHNIQYLGELDPLISKNGLIVTPFVGLIDYDYEVNLNEDEVDSIFRVPLAWFFSQWINKMHKSDVALPVSQSIGSSTNLRESDEKEGLDHLTTTTSNPDPRAIQSRETKQGFIMEGILYKTHHYLSAKECNDRSLLSMFHEETREFRIWGFSLGVMIRLFKRGWNVKYDSWGNHFDIEGFKLWVKQSKEQRRREKGV